MDESSLDKDFILWLTFNVAFSYATLKVQHRSRLDLIDSLFEKMIIFQFDKQSSIDREWM